MVGVALNVLLLTVAFVGLTAGHTERGGGMADDMVSTGAVFSEADIAQWAAEVIAPQVAELGCDSRKRLSPEVAVRNAHGFDRGVVRRVSFDEGRALAQAGKVYVEGYCS